MGEGTAQPPGAQRHSGGSSLRPHAQAGLPECGGRASLAIAGRLAGTLHGQALPPVPFPRELCAPEQSPQLLWARFPHLSLQITFLSVSWACEITWSRVIHSWAKGGGGGDLGDRRRPRGDGRGGHSPPSRPGPSRQEEKPKAESPAASQMLGICCKCSDHEAQAASRIGGHAALPSVSPAWVSVSEAAPA